MRRLSSVELQRLSAELHDVGATKVTELLDSAEIADLENILDECIRDKNQMLLDYGSKGKVINGFFLWRKNGRLARFVTDTYLPEMLAELMCSKKVNLFCDNIFFKEPKTAVHISPWHNDQANWIVDGNQVTTVWISLDHVTRESGAMKFARGSHRWQFLEDGRCAKDGEDFQPVATLCERLNEDDIVCHELAPGDATVHLGNTLHAASGNRTAHLRRRGYAVRYTGDDAVYRPNPMFETPVPIELAPGAPLDSELFPLLRKRAR